jgi:purine-nucleoside/S-methyl-5'-thioadenosine phosphorylase / adenosine deaminase
LTAEARRGTCLLHSSPILNRGPYRGGITTRVGFPPAAGPNDPDSPDRAATRSQLAKLLHKDLDQLSWVRQVHGNSFVEATEGGCLGEADALVCEDPSRTLLISVADCVPVLIWDERLHLHAAIHAGWRGVVAGVIPAVLAWFADKRSDPKKLRAWLGPHIAPDHFEVGPKVAEQFDNKHVIAATTADTNPHVDLAAAIESQLCAGGLDPARIARSPYCTFTDADLFWSYRRDGGICGRHVAYLGG